MNAVAPVPQLDRPVHVVAMGELRGRLGRRHHDQGGSLTPPAEHDAPKLNEMFVGRPLTHSAVSPNREELPKLHADPCLQPLGRASSHNSNAAPPQVNVISFMSSLNNVMQDEAKMVVQNRAQYDSILSEQRRKSNVIRSSTESIEKLSDASGQAAGLESPLGKVVTRRNTGYNSADDLVSLPPTQGLPNRQRPGLRRRPSREDAAGAANVYQQPAPVTRHASNNSPARGRPPHHPAPLIDPDQLAYPHPPSEHLNRESSSEQNLTEGESGQESPFLNVPGAGGKKKKGLKRRHLKGQGRIKVVVRKRPLNATGLESGGDVVTTYGQAISICEHKERIDLSKYTEKQTFQFDSVFDDACMNHDVFVGTALPLIDTFFEGGNASCFAYGQTGSGKTYTMLGARDGEEGLYLLAARDLFRRLGPSHTVTASFYEIYCNTLYDLLGERKVLYAREDANRKVNIVGLSEHSVDNVADLVRLMEIADKNRSSGSTAANEHSSRSHAILSLTMTHEDKPDFGATFKFIDLAGSERGADTAERGRKTQQEGAEINKSLLALKECIRGLDLGHHHIKFRGSKLTEVLRDSFTGNCRTVMIATLSPSSQNVEHTLNTLRYANRVKGLPTKSMDPSKERNHQPLRKPSMPLMDVERDKELDKDAKPARGREKHKSKAKRARSMPVQKKPSANVVSKEDSDVNASEDGFDDPNLPPGLIAGVRKRMDRQKQQIQQMEHEIAQLRKALQDKDSAHKQEIGMCKMVKRMDEQRILLLEDHNSSLQKKIQELSR
ncbi:Kinesin-related protein 6 [Diplonema papillatum]|nr:Kinesin-related protein 6 [Diplonema papillatum]